MIQLMVVMIQAVVMIQLLLLVTQVVVVIQLMLMIQVEMVMIQVSGALSATDGWWGWGGMMMVMVQVVVVVMVVVIWVVMTEKSCTTEHIHNSYPQGNWSHIQTDCCAIDAGRNAGARVDKVCRRK